MTTEDQELKEFTDKLTSIDDMLWDPETELVRLSRKPIVNGEPTKMTNLDFEILDSTRRLVSLAVHQLKVLRVDLEARMD